MRPEGYQCNQLKKFFESLEGDNRYNEQISVKILKAIATLYLLFILNLLIKWANANLLSSINFYFIKNGFLSHQVVAATIYKFWIASLLMKSFADNCEESSSHNSIQSKEINKRAPKKIDWQSGPILLVHPILIRPVILIMFFLLLTVSFFHQLLKLIATAWFDELRTDMTKLLNNNLPPLWFLYSCCCFLFVRPDNRIYADKFTPIEYHSWTKMLADVLKSRRQQSFVFSLAFTLILIGPRFSLMSLKAVNNRHSFSVLHYSPSSRTNTLADVLKGRRSLLSSTGFDLFWHLIHSSFHFDGLDLQSFVEIDRDLARCEKVFKQLHI
ncbi:hypothetical protein PGT21_018965 [Puccinia graminis f. sp. tritici]|uniref:Uncharacterized protein n=1 Tax=Puccinia graminis f. sp. tritici TaxID=56615 RepID=A0A5B0P4P5_PUCGR|nr:hypothetical protein PGT21_018965 [Puccinia graminis f. sp. tritici]KAA1131919.1 hypothetical protein PGTUg99_033747 [Puccinia graminis f. sp. tritici]